MKWNATVHFRDGTKQTVEDYGVLNKDGHDFTFHWLDSTDSNANVTHSVIIPRDAVKYIDAGVEK